MRIAPAIFLACIALFAPLAARADEPSVERGLYVSILGGCHDCHSMGYSENQGKINPATALRGSTVGFQGPWGTTYPPNLRLIASKMTEDFFLRIASTLETAPPMPWYNVRNMTETDIRSLYRYILSLGEPGAAAPLMVAPGDRLKTPYIVVAPPQPVPPCGSDFDCGIGEICGTAEPRQCVKR